MGRKLYHPELGAEIEVERDVHADLLIRRAGWVDGSAPAPTVGDTLEGGEKKEEKVQYSRKKDDNKEVS